MFSIYFISLFWYINILIKLMSRLKQFFNLLYFLIVVLIASIICLCTFKPWPIYSALIFLPFLLFYCFISLFMEKSIAHKFTNKPKRLVFFIVLSVIKQLLMIMPLLIVCLIYAPFIYPIVFVISYTVCFFALNMITPFIFNNK
jgi:hypothetical protein